MKSATLPSFWDAYRVLDDETRQRAQKAYQRWMHNPFHPPLQFNSINDQENIWSVRADLDLRAIGVIEDDTITWFWIGSHDQYERFFSR